MCANACSSSDLNLDIAKQICLNVKLWFNTTSDADKSCVILFACILIWTNKQACVIGLRLIIGRVLNWLSYLDLNLDLKLYLNLNLISNLNSNLDVDLELDLGLDSNLD